MDMYKANLGGLLAVCGALFAAQRLAAPKSATSESKEGKGKKATPSSQKAADNPEAVQWAFLVVYSLVMGADWLQVREPSSKRDSASLDHTLTPSGPLPVLPVP